MVKELPDWKSPIIKKGEVIALFEGSYADTQLDDIFIATKRFNLEVAHMKFYKIKTRSLAFTSWLETEGLIKIYKFRELNLDNFRCTI